MPSTPSSPSSLRSRDLERTPSKRSRTRPDWQSSTTGTTTPKHAADCRVMSRRSSQSADGLSRSTSTLNNDHRGRPFSKSPSALKRSQPQQPRYLLSTASARNRVQFRAAKSGDASRDGAVNSPSPSPGRSRYYNRAWREGIASSSNRNEAARPFQSRSARRFSDNGGDRTYRYRQREAAAAARAAATAVGSKSGSSTRYVRTQSDYETEIERLREVLHKEIRAKDRLRFELRRALDSDSDETGLDDCKIICATRPVRSFWSIPSLTRSGRSSRWSRSPDRYTKHDFHGSHRSLPLTPREFWNPNRHLVETEGAGPRWYAVDSTADYGGRALDSYDSQTPHRRGYKPKVRYYYDDDDEIVLRKLRRDRARKQYDGEGCSRVQVRIGWPWLCFPGRHFHHSRRKELQELRQYNRQLSAQLQRLEEGRTLKQGLEIGTSLDEEVAANLPRLEVAPTVPPPPALALETRVEEPSPEGQAVVSLTQ